MTLMGLLQPPFGVVGRSFVLFTQLGPPAFPVGLDELWWDSVAARAWWTGVDALTLLNRLRRRRHVMISHTMSVLLALPLEEDGDMVWNVLG